MQKSTTYCLTVNVLIELADREIEALCKEGLEMDQVHAELNNLTLSFQDLKTDPKDGTMSYNTRGSDWAGTSTYVILTPES